MKKRYVEINAIVRLHVLFQTFFIVGITWKDTIRLVAYVALTIYCLPYYSINIQTIKRIYKNVYWILWQFCNIDTFYYISIIEVLQYQYYTKVLRILNRMENHKISYILQQIYIQFWCVQTCIHVGIHKKLQLEVSDVMLLPND